MRAFSYILTFRSYADKLDDAFSVNTQKIISMRTAVEFKEN